MDKIKEGIKRIQEQQNRDICVVKERLAEWIIRQNGPIPSDIDPRERAFYGPYTEINAALLEMAIDRMLALLGGDDTRELILKAFDRRAAAYKQSLL